MFWVEFLTHNFAIIYCSTIFDAVINCNILLFVLVSMRFGHGHLTLFSPQSSNSV